MLGIELRAVVALTCRALGFPIALYQVRIILHIAYSKWLQSTPPDVRTSFPFEVFLNSILLYLSFKMKSFVLANFLQGFYLD